MTVALAWIGIIAVVWATLTLLIVMFIKASSVDDVLEAAVISATIVAGLLVFVGGLLIVVGLGNVIARAS